MRLVSALAASAFALIVASPALADGKISLTGTGIVHAVPDMATITTGVTTQAATAREALDANTAAMDALVASLYEAGLEGRDIQTSDFTVSPQYVYSDQRDPSGYTLPPEIAGYQVSNAVSITVRNLDDLGVILDRAVSTGANTINGIAFGVEDTKKLLEQARRLAYAEALDKANTYADVAGFQLGTIEAITERDDYMPPQPMLRAARMEMAMDAAVPVETGEMAYSVTVNVTWEIED